MLMVWVAARILNCARFIYTLSINRFPETYIDIMSYKNRIGDSNLYRTFQGVGLCLWYATFSIYLSTYTEGILRFS